MNLFLVLLPARSSAMFRRLFYFPVLLQTILCFSGAVSYTHLNNIGWSRLLEDAGCRVIYGLDGYKVHSKLCLITKKTDEQIEYYTQIGTGNYNEKTSRLYTDLSLMTYNVDIGLEAANVFQALAMGETIKHVDHLLVAPKCLQNKILDMIDEEIAHARACLLYTSMPRSTEPSTAC